MKRILRYTLMLLAAGCVFTACTEEETITPAAKPTGAQVFFSSELPTAYEINPEESSINVTVSRYDAGEALTVPVTVTKESDKYTIPATVTFAAGETTAQLPVSYVPADIEYGKYETITLGVGDESMTTPYGYSTYSFTIGVTDWTDWGPWNSAGTATYTYNLYWSGDDEGLPFVYRHNIIKTNIYQFKLSNWGYGVDIVFEYDEATGDVTCEPTYTGLADASGYGPLYVANFNYYQGVIRGKTPGTDFTPSYGAFDKEEGIIAIPMSYYVSAGTFGAAYEYIYIDGYTRADVSCDIAYAGKFTAVDESVSVVADVTLGADVTSAFVALVPGDLTDEVLSAIAAGEYENMVEVSQSGEVKFPATDMEDGKYTFVVVSFLNGEFKEYASSSFTYETAVGVTWTPIGTGTYTYVAWDAEEAEPDPGYVLSKRDDKDDVYRIEEWFYGVNLVFTWDKATNKCQVDEQFTGYTHPSYGDVYVCDGPTFSSQLADKPVLFDPATSTFKFYLVYYCSAGVFARDVDTFEVTFNETSGVKGVARAKKVFSQPYNVNNSSTCPRVLPKNHGTQRGAMKSFVIKKALRNL